MAVNVPVGTHGVGRIWRINPDFSALHPLGSAGGKADGCGSLSIEIRSIRFLREPGAPSGGLFPTFDSRLNIFALADSEHRRAFKEATMRDDRISMLEARLDRLESKLDRLNRRLVEDKAVRWELIKICGSVIAVGIGIYSIPGLWPLMLVSLAVGAVIMVVALIKISREETR